MIEHTNRLEPQPGPIVRSRLPAAVSAVLCGGYDFSGMVAVAITRKLDQLAELSARTGRSLCLWLVHLRTIEVKNDCWDDCVDLTESPVIGLLDHHGYDTLHWKAKYPRE